MWNVVDCVCLLLNDICMYLKWLKNVKVNTQLVCDFGFRSPLFKMKFYLLIFCWHYQQKEYREVYLVYSSWMISSVDFDGLNLIYLILGVWHIKRMKINTNYSTITSRYESYSYGSPGDKGQKHLCLRIRVSAL